MTILEHIEKVADFTEDPETFGRIVFTAINRNNPKGVSGEDAEIAKELKKEVIKFRKRTDKKREYIKNYMTKYIKGKKEEK